MKIALNMDELSSGDKKATEGKALEKLILATGNGDFEARDTLYQHYLPLLTSLAKKRTSNVAEINQFIERGKAGLITATRKYKTSIGSDKFKLFALNYIEKSMDAGSGKGGLFSRLFGSG